MIENAIYQLWITLDICFDLYVLPIYDLLKHDNYVTGGDTVCWGYQLNCNWMKEAKIN